MEQLKVVIVEDDEGSREILMHIVSRTLGHTAITASDGKEALEIIKAERPDLVITDLMMSGMGGLDLLRNLKKLGGPEEVIMVSAHGSMEKYLEAMELGVYETINKPFHPAEIVRIIKKFVEGRNN